MDVLELLSIRWELWNYDGYRRNRLPNNISPDLSLCGSWQEKKMGFSLSLSLEGGSGSSLRNFIKLNYKIESLTLKGVYVGLLEWLKLKLGLGHLIQSNWVLIK